MDKTREVLKMLEGSHNFASFAMNKKSRLQTKRSPDQQEKIVTVRTFLKEFRTPHKYWLGS